MNVSFAATSYTNPIASTNTSTTSGSGGEALTLQSRNVFKQYLEAVLGLTDFDGGSSSGWPMEFVTTSADADVNHGSYPNRATMTAIGGIGLAGRGPLTPAAGSTSSSSSTTALLCATALLCLVCSHVSPPNASLANRAAKTCSERIGKTAPRPKEHSLDQTCWISADQVRRSRLACLRRLPRRTVEGRSER